MKIIINESQLKNILKSPDFDDDYEPTQDEIDTFIRHRDQKPDYDSMADDYKKLDDHLKKELGLGLYYKNSRNKVKEMAQGKPAFLQKLKSKYITEFPEIYTKNNLFIGYRKNFR